MTISSTIAESWKLLV
ncbi:hypothetical protein NQ314_012104 [Rhamnusium bicolor]|uniref:Uncharacterized protein n=1 Tax=Rhamnusium bicolor TaxID=1586634 RepID=A0AAV8XDB9_9CUCU|nr:hypothetical protein NQ314_012104 [Rhamnusium bicolor]